MDIIQVDPMLSKNADLDKEADDNLGTSQYPSATQKDMGYDPDMLAQFISSKRMSNVIK